MVGFAVDVAFERQIAFRPVKRAVANVMDDVRPPIIDLAAEFISLGRGQGGDFEFAIALGHQLCDAALDIAQLPVRLEIFLGVCGHHQNADRTFNRWGQVGLGIQLANDVGRGADRQKAITRAEVERFPRDAR